MFVNGILAQIARDKADEYDGAMLQLNVDKGNFVEISNEINSDRGLGARQGFKAGFVDEATMKAIAVRGFILDLKKDKITYYKHLNASPNSAGQNFRYLIIHDKNIRFVMPIGK